MEHTQSPTRTESPPGGAQAAGPERMSPRARKAATAGFLGFAVDYYDIYLPMVALAPAMHYFQPENLSGSLETTLFYLTFAVTLIGRPIGSTIFGSLSDRIGRRKSTLIAVAGFTACTFLMAALPGFQSAGWLGLGGLMLLRLVGGIFMGGEYTSANPLALEASPKHRRGIVGALIGSAYPIGYIAISIVTLPLLAWLPSDAVGDAYTQWGWRIPFVVGGLLGVAFFVYFLRSIDESEVWKKDVAAPETKEAAKTPLRELFAGPNFRRLAQLFILMSGLWFAVQSIISPMTGLLIGRLEQDSGAVTTAMLLANVVLFGGYLLYGHLGQRYGRRRVLMLSGIATATVAAGTFFTTIAMLEGGGSFTLAMVIYTIGLVLAISPYGVATVYLLEAFPTKVRASGYGVAYSMSLIIPSCYAAYMLGLETFMPYVYTPVVLIVLSGLLTFTGARMGTETKDVDFT